MKRDSMLLVALAASLLALPVSVVCGQGQTLDKVLSHDGIQRNYKIYVPSGYQADDSLPLVVNMHGVTLNSEFQMTRSGMNAVAEREGFLVAYPDAVNANWFGPQDNIGFIDALLSDVSSAYTVDTSRVYATGYSQGAIMSYILSVARSDTFAAIAPVAAWRPFAGETDVIYPPGLAPLPDRPFPVLQIHGTNDSFVPYEGGEGAFGAHYLPLEQVLGEFALLNGADLTPTITDLPDVDPTDGSTVQLYSYENGVSYLDAAGDQHQAEVLLLRVEGGGHSWPGDFDAWPDFGLPVNNDFSASTEIWKFFSRHALPQTDAIPEPSTLVLVLAATCLVGVAAFCRRPREFDFVGSPQPLIVLRDPSTYFAREGNRLDD